jgi:hypothetical protein
VIAAAAGRVPTETAAEAEMREEEATIAADTAIHAAVALFDRIMLKWRLLLEQVLLVVRCLR